MIRSERVGPAGSGELWRRWRTLKGTIFACLAAASLISGLVIIIVLVFTTALQAWKLVAMRATADAGLALSMRGLEINVDGRSKSLPYVTAAQVGERSAAEGLGIRQGDAVVQVGGHAVDQTSEVWAAIETARKGNVVRLPIVWVPRVDQLFGELSPEPIPGQRGKYRAWLSYVQRGSPAEEAGLRVGDVLVSVDGLSISGTRQAWQAVVVASRRTDEPVMLTVERGDRTLEIPLQAEQRGELVLEPDVWGALMSFILNLDEPRYPEQAGLASAILGSLYVMLVMGLVTFPLGAAAAIYLEEYATRNFFTETIQVLIANLAGIPSVAYGIIGLEVFARASDLGRSILAGGLTLGLVILPIMIIAAREALRAVPPWIREAAYGIGATKWQVVRHHVLPTAMPGMFTGMILSLAQAIGESAPLILLGAFLYVNYLPSGIFSNFTVVPLQIFDWATKPQPGYTEIAAAAIIILLVILFILNALAIWLRNRYQQTW